MLTSVGVLIGRGMGKGYWSRGISPLILSISVGIQSPPNPEEVVRKPSGT